MTNRASGQTNTGSPRLLLAALVALFVVTRALLHFGITPFFDGDTYKYLGGADALWAGQELPTLFRDLATTGGGLHAVPGYAWFLDAIWKICGRVTLPEILIVQSLISLLGMLAAADLARRWAGIWTSIALFGVLATAPTIAWLEHLVMPDLLAVPLFWLAGWLVVVAPFTSDRGARAAGNGMACGLLLAAELLLRTASKIFVPLVFLLALRTQRDFRSFLLWFAACALSMTAGLLPWLAHNHRHHGSWTVSSSTGRNLYFSALWSNTIERAPLLERYGLQEPTGSAVRSSFAISNETLRRLMADGRTLAQSDAAMRDLALEAYRTTPPATVLQQRFALMRGLFVRSPGVGEWLEPLRPNGSRALENRFYGDAWRTWASGAIQYTISDRVGDAQRRAAHPPNTAATFFSWWVRLLAIEGLPLLALYAIALPMLLRLPGERTCAFLFFAAPPLAFLAVFTVFGAPLYRYQAALHPFMLATVVLGACALVSRRSSADASSSAPRR